MLIRGVREGGDQRFSCVTPGVRELLFGVSASEVAYLLNKMRRLRESLVCGVNQGNEGGR